MKNKNLGIVMGLVVLSFVESGSLASTVPFIKIQMESWSPYYFPEAASVAPGTVV